MGDHLRKEISDILLGSASRVFNELKPGLDVKIYERALIVELDTNGLSVAQEKSFPVYYRNHYIGEINPSLIVGDAVIVDAKVAKAFSDLHIAQLQGLLNITGLKVGYLLNFAHAKVQWKRLVRERQRKEFPQPYSLAQALATESAV